jgi:hypothetical protein
MLFDLRSRGRRRTVQVVYGFLAVLIGGGLVFFGIGGGAGSTGLLTQLENQGTGSPTGIKIDETAVEMADRAVKRDPTSTAAWDRYARAVLTLADTNYVSSKSGFTRAGAKELAVLEHAWYRYLALNPTKPDETLAADVASAFGPSGIQEWAVAESGQEVVAEDDNSADEYYTLAAYAYFAHEPDRAQLAEARALALAPKSERKTITSDLAKVAAEASGSTGSSGATGTSG